MMSTRYLSYAHAFNFGEEGDSSQQAPAPSTTSWHIEWMLHIDLNFSPAAGCLEGESNSSQQAPAQSRASCYTQWVLHTNSPQWVLHTNSMSHLQRVCQPSRVASSLRLHTPTCTDQHSCWQTSGFASSAEFCRPAHRKYPARLEPFAQFA
jgi:hypothetical protein